MGYLRIGFCKKEFVMIAYEFYCRLKTGAEQLIGILPERRTDSERITQHSIMNWIAKVLPDHSNSQLSEIYFVQVKY